MTSGSEESRRRAVSGTAANIAGSVLRGFLLFAGGLIFARALGPGPMGEFALAASITGLAQLVLEVGLGSALVQQADLRERDVRFVFTLTSALGIAAAVASVAIAVPLTRAVNIESALPAVVVLAVGLVAQGLSHTAMSLLRRELAFRKLQAALVAGYFVGLVAIGLPLALVGVGSVAPAAAVTVQQVLVAMWAMKARRHSKRATITSRREIMRFTGGAVGANISNWSIANLDTMLVAQQFGSSALGLYSRAYFLAFTPISTVMSAFQGALFSAASRLSGNRRATSSAYLASLNIAAVTMLPPLVLIATVPELTVLALYGPAWLDAAPVLRVLALGMPFLVLGSPATAVLWSLGRAPQDAAATAGAALFMLASLLILSPSSIRGVATIVLAAYAVRFLGQAILCLRYLSVAHGDMARAIAPGLLLCIVAWVSVYGWSALLRGRHAPIFELVAVSIATVITVALVGFFLRAWLLMGATTDLLALLRPSGRERP